ncbi:MAG: phage head-tail connector protein [Trueperaceae bacterium]
MNGRTAWKTTTPPAVEPITLVDAKAELGIPTADTTQDARITRLITAARSMAEAYTNRAFITQTITFSLDTFPHDHGNAEPWWDGVRQAARSTLTGARAAAPIYLPRPPLIELLGVAYITPDGTPTPLDLTTLLIDDMSEPARVMPAGPWPPTRPALGVTITYRAGYGSNPSDVPPVVAEAILEHVRATLEQPDATIASETIDNASVTYRQQTGSGAGDNLPSVGLRGNAQMLLTPLRVRDLGALTSPLA